MTEATKRYKENRKEIDQQLSRIAAAILKMDKEQESKEKDWGFAGSASHVASELKDLANFLEGVEE